MCVSEVSVVLNTRVNSFSNELCMNGFLLRAVTFVLWELIKSLASLLGLKPLCVTLWNMDWSGSEDKLKGFVFFLSG